MKKNYIKPEIKGYEMEPQQSLAASDSDISSLRGRTADNHDEMW